MCVLAATAAVCVSVPGFLHFMFLANQFLFLVSRLQKWARLIAGSIPVRTVVFFLFFAVRTASWLLCCQHCRFFQCLLLFAVSQFVFKLFTCSTRLALLVWARTDSVRPGSCVFRSCSSFVAGCSCRKSRKGLVIGVLCHLLRRHVFLSFLPFCFLLAPFGSRVPIYVFVCSFFGSSWILPFHVF